jgi:thioesterase domain-containing protein
VPAEPPAPAARSALKEYSLPSNWNDPLADQARFARYKPRPYPGRVVYFRTRDTAPHQCRDPYASWDRLARGGLEIYDIPGTHGDLLRPPHVKGVAEQFKVVLEKAQRGM